MFYPFSFAKNAIPAVDLSTNKFVCVSKRQNVN